MNIFRFWLGVFSLSFFRLHIGGSSKSSTASTTNNNDKRNAVQDGIGISGDRNALAVNTTTNITDGGIVSRALQSVDLANTTSGAGLSDLLDTAGDLFGMQSQNQAVGFETLLNVAGDIFNQGQGLIGQTQKAVADAYGQAQNDKAGTIDNRTIIVLAVAGAAALFFASRRK